MPAMVLPAGPPPITITSKTLAFISVGSSCISHRSQFWFQKLREKTINLQQTGACQFDRSVVSPEQIVPGQALVDRLKFAPYLVAELSAKVGGVERAGFELKNHLSDELLFWRQI